MTVENVASGPVAWIDEAGIVWVSIERTVRFAGSSDTTRPPAGWTELVPKKPVQVHGLCDKHVHLGHFPVEAKALPCPAVETVCPWCERKASR